MSQFDATAMLLRHVKQPTKSYSQLKHGRTVWVSYLTDHTYRSRKMDKPVVLITGALSGIGRASAIAFAEKGAIVVVSGRRDEAGKTLAQELRSFGSEAEFI